MQRKGGCRRGVSPKIKKLLENRVGFANKMLYSRRFQDKGPYTCRGGFGPLFALFWANYLMISLNIEKRMYVRTLFASECLTIILRRPATNQSNSFSRWRENRLGAVRPECRMTCFSEVVAF